MTYLLDTDICIYILNGPTSRLRLNFNRAQQGEVGISTVTEAELYFGAFHSKFKKLNLERVEGFLSPLKKIHFNSESAYQFGEIKENLVRRGQSVGEMDMLIAATAKAHGLTLITNNAKHFRRIKGLKVENWL